MQKQTFYSKLIIDFSFVVKSFVFIRKYFFDMHHFQDTDPESLVLTEKIQFLDFLNRVRLSIPENMFFKRLIKFQMKLLKRL